MLQRVGAGILAGDPRRVGRRRPELLPDLLGGVQQPEGVRKLLDILACPSRPMILLAGVSSGWGSGNQGESGRKRVPAPGDLPGQLQVLHLVLAHRHLGGAVQQDVRCLSTG